MYKIENQIDRPRVINLLATLIHLISLGLVSPGSAFGSAALCGNWRETSASALIDFFLRVFLPDAPYFNSAVLRWTRMAVLAPRSRASKLLFV